jgi:hypothetical protein
MIEIALFCRDSAKRFANRMFYLVAVFTYVISAKVLVSFFMAVGPASRGFPTSSTPIPAGRSAGMQMS